MKARLLPILALIIAASGLPVPMAESPGTKTSRPAIYEEKADGPGKVLAFLSQWART